MPLVTGTLTPYPGFFFINRYLPLAPLARSNRAYRLNTHIKPHALNGAKNKGRGKDTHESKKAKKGRNIAHPPPVHSFFALSRPGAGGRQSRRAGAGAKRRQIKKNKKCLCFRRHLQNSLSLTIGEGRPERLSSIAKSYRVPAH